MAQGFEKIPLKLEFDENFGFKEEFVKRLGEVGVFSLRSVNKSYFSLIMDSILRDEDPLPIIEEFEPEMHGSPHMHLFVKEATSSLNSHNVTFIYDPGLTEDDFNQKCLEALGALRTRVDKIILGNTGFRALKGLFGASNVFKKELADAYFLKKDYENALCIYVRLGNLGVCRRMSEICRALMNTNLLGDPLSLDIMIFYKKFDILYAISENLPFDAKLAIQYYLVKQDLPKYMRVLLEYSCCRGFSLTKNNRKLSSTMDSLRDFARHESASVANSVWAGREFWNDFGSALEFEFGSGSGDGPAMDCTNP